MFSKRLTGLFTILLTIIYSSQSRTEVCHDAYCIFECSTEFPCIGDTIDFRNATEGSILVCRGSNSCEDIILYCPLNADPSTCEQDNTCYNCEIRGIDIEIFESHNDWTIYAPNSFNDLTLIDFNVYMEGTMYCNHDYSSSCSIEYGLFNCKNNTNECYVNNDNQQNIHCNGYKSCFNQTINCEDVSAEITDGVCNVICSGELSCSSSIINCGNNKECNILCTGQSSCQGIPIEDLQQNDDNNLLPSVIQCPIDNNCNVICGKSLNDGDTDIVTSSACLNAFIIADNSRNDLNINVMGPNSLSFAKISGPDFGSINVQCNEYQSCNDAIFRGNQSQSVNIACNQELESCEDIWVWCPSATDNEKNCHITGISADYHSNLQLYCIDGWNDIDINDYSGTIDPSGTSSMHCSDISKYDAQCTIDSEFSCICPPGGTLSPTGSPTESPTGSDIMPGSTEMDDDTEGDQTTRWVVGAVFVGFAVIASIVGVLFCYKKYKINDSSWCVCLDDENKSQPDTSDKVKSVDDDDDNDNGNQSKKVSKSKSKSGNQYQSLGADADDADVDVDADVRDVDVDNDADAHDNIIDIEENQRNDDQNDKNDGNVDNDGVNNDNDQQKQKDNNTSKDKVNNNLLQSSSSDEFEMRFDDDPDDQNQNKNNDNTDKDKNLAIDDDNN